MTAWTKEQFIPGTRAIATAYTLLCRTAILAGLLTMMPLSAGCGGGDTESTPPAAASVGSAVSFAWDPVEDHSVHAYFVHYGRQSPAQKGSCSYESTLYTESPSATVTNLDPGTRYFFAVSAFNDILGTCSDEVSIVTPSSPG